MSPRRVSRAWAALIGRVPECLEFQAAADILLFDSHLATDKLNPACVRQSAHVASMGRDHLSTRGTLYALDLCCALLGSGSAIGRQIAPDLEFLSDSPRARAMTGQHFDSALTVFVVMCRRSGQTHIESHELRI